MLDKILDLDIEIIVSLSNRTNEVVNITMANNYTYHQQAASFIKPPYRYEGLHIQMIDSDGNLANTKAYFKSYKSIDLMHSKYAFKNIHFYEEEQPGKGVVEANFENDNRHYQPKLFNEYMLEDISSEKAAELFDKYSDNALPTIEYDYLELSQCEDEACNIFICGKNGKALFTVVPFHFIGTMIFRHNTLASKLFMEDENVNPLLEEYFLQNSNEFCLDIISSYKCTFS